VRLLIIGDGPERDNLQDRVRHMEASSRPYFAGMVPYEEVPRYLAMADAFVTLRSPKCTPYRSSKPWPPGCPSWASNPGIGDTIQDNVSGYLAAEEDLASFTARMVRLVIDSESRQKMGAQARQASTLYDIERTRA